MNYYRSNQQRTVRGRYTRRRIDWDRLVEDFFMLAIFGSVGVECINLALKAHGL